MNKKPNNILNIWKDKGIFDKSLINIIIKPLLQSKGIVENITLQKFYEITKIEIANDRIKHSIAIWENFS